MSNLDLETLARQDLKGLPPYTPSTISITEVERIVKLDANENPYGPSPKVHAALTDTRVWNRYITQDQLLPALAQYAGVPPEHIVVGNGADELIDLVGRVLLEPGDAVIDCSPSFEMYAQYALINRARVIDVPRRGEAFEIDLAGIERTVAAEHPKIVFVTNPNNPDGGLLTEPDLERLLALPALVVLDEAYAEFAEASATPRVPRLANLVTIRTFSKWAGLAGLRLGFVVGPRWLIDSMMRMKPPYNVNSAAIVAAGASLQDVDYLRGNVRRIVAERGRLAECLAGIRFLQPLPSTANFILCRVKGLDTHDLQRRLAERGILIRAYRSPRMQGYIRISVGTPEEDDTLVRALAEIGAVQ